MRGSLASMLSLAALCVNLATPGQATGPIRLHEAFPADYQYQVSVRVELEGSLNVPDPKQSAPKSVRVTGQSAIDYDERILATGKEGRVEKTVRHYRRIEFQRVVGDQPQTSTLRQQVRRLVVLRHEQSEVPFSPDGPLTWAEIDLVRTDVFTPTLSGLLPDKPVQPGDRWTAAPAAVRELTDLERIEDGGLECQFEQLTNLNGRRYARVGFSGAVRGVNEDGPNRQQLEGYFFFDLESAHLSYLSLKGTSNLLDKEGKPLGQVTGRFVLTRQAQAQSRELSAEALRGVTVEPNEDNTLLLYEHPELGLRLLHPRSWRMTGVRGRQVAFDEAGGHGLLVTVEPAARVPTAAQFLAESRDYLQKQKARVLATEAPRRLQSAPTELDQFALDLDVAGQRVWMDYFVVRQAAGGVTLAARLVEANRSKARRDVERIARSVTITPPK
jgi:hypothetical protein